MLNTRIQTENVLISHSLLWSNKVKCMFTLIESSINANSSLERRAHQHTTKPSLDFRIFLAANYRLSVVGHLSSLSHNTTFLFTSTIFYHYFYCKYVIKCHEILLPFFHSFFTKKKQKKKKLRRFSLKYTVTHSNNEIERHNLSM